MKNKIVIIGTNNENNMLIRKAKELDFEVHVFAWATGSTGEKEADYFYPISVLDTDKIYEECIKIKPQAVLSVASDHCALSCEIISNKLGISKNNLDTVRMMTNKLETRKKMYSNINEPTFYDADNIGDVTYPVIVKPSDRSNNRGITIVYNQNKLNEAIAKARDISFERKAIVEELIKGNEYFAEVYSKNGVHRILTYTSVIKDLSGSIPLHTEYSQPVYFDEKTNDLVEFNINKILNIFNYKDGPSHIEFIIDDDKFIFIEASPTIGGEHVGSLLVNKAFDFDYLKYIILDATGSEEDFNLVKNEGIYSLRIINNENDYLRYKRLKNINSTSIISDEYAPNKDGDIGPKFGFYLLHHNFKEMGSFLPLEINKKSEYLTYPNKIGLNSYKSALTLALKTYKDYEVYIPYVYNSSAVNWIKNTGTIIRRYHIGEDLLPIEKLDGKCVILMNYFGLMDKRIEEYVNNHPAKYIIDNSFAFFSKHIEGTLSIYVPSNFFGVTNGAYLVGDNINYSDLSKDVSYGQATHLLKALELGTNAAYKEYSADEQHVSNEIMLMSKLTEDLLKTIDYEEVKKKRVDNYHFLLERFSVDSLYKDDETIPQCFPLIVKEDIRKKLIDKKIYVPYYFRKLEDNDLFNQYELQIIYFVNCLPVDQRYEEEDMDYLINVIESILSIK